MFLCRRDELQEVYAPHRGENRHSVNSAQMAPVRSGSRHGICLCVCVQEDKLRELFAPHRSEKHHLMSSADHLSQVWFTAWCVCMQEDKLRKLYAQQRSEKQHLVSSTVGFSLVWFKAWHVCVQEDKLRELYAQHSSEKRHLMSSAYDFSQVWCEAWHVSVCVCRRTNCGSCLHSTAGEAALGEQCRWLQSGVVQGMTCVCVCVQEDKLQKLCAQHRSEKQWASVRSGARHGMSVCVCRRTSCGSCMHSTAGRRGT